MMRNIGITTLVTLLVLSTAIIGSGHVVLAHNDKYTRDFSNSGNNQEIQQDCGNSCTDTSSNTITFGSSGLTTPSPSPSPPIGHLTLTILSLGGNAFDVSGRLTTFGGSAISGATIFFVANFVSGGPLPIEEGVVTNATGYYQIELDLPPNVPFASITAQYTGSAQFPVEVTKNIQG